MPALSEALVPTERDVTVAKETQRQMGDMKFGTKEEEAEIYKQREKEARLGVLDELAAEGKRLNMGY
ncbi:MAG: hypothetical protein ACOYMN_22540 [Roseimicrobium sp.]